MAQQVVNIGSAANDGTGDPARTAFGKVNSNFTEVYNLVGAALLSAKDFGILPTNTGAQNDSGFAAMKAVMLADPDVTWHLLFDPGIYQYDNNRWLFGVQSVVIEAHGASFQCSLDNAWGQNQWVFNNCDPFDDRGDFARTGGILSGGNDVFVNGHLFDTAIIGSKTITCTTAADSDEYSIGERVLVYGYDQQMENSYPPNMRYHEFKTIIAIDAGDITFDTPLGYTYDDRWVDIEYDLSPGSVFYGKPRILSLERPNYKHAKYIHIKGATFKENLVNSPVGNVRLCGDTIIYDDCKFTGDAFAIQSGSEFTAYYRCYLRQGSEGDKNCGTVVLEDCISGEPSDFVAFTGMDLLVLSRCKIYSTLQVWPRKLIIRDCDLYSNLGDQNALIRNNGAPPLHRLVVSGTNFHNTRPGGVTWAISAGVVWTLTVDSVGGSGEILLVWDATAITTHRWIDIGMRLTCGNNTGMLQEIYHDGGSPGNLVLVGTWTTPTVGDVFTIRPLARMTDGGGNRIVGTQVPMWRNPEWVEGNGLQTMWIPSDRMTPTVSNGAAAATVETTAGNPDHQVLDFDNTADEHAQFQVAFPKRWNKGTVQFQAYWTAGSIGAGHGVAIALQGVAVPNVGSVNVAYGTAVVVTDLTTSGATNLYVSEVSTAVTIASSPQDDQLCYFRIFRDVSDAADGMAQDMRLIGIKLFWLAIQPTDELQDTD